MARSLVASAGHLIYHHVGAGANPMGAGNRYRSKTTLDTTPDPQLDADGPRSAGGCRRFVRTPAMLLLSLVAVAAGCLVLALLASAVYTQRNPGGLLSSIRVGAPAPDFELPTADGGTVRLSALRGRPVMVTFWATWCPGCAKELPVLAEAETRHADAGLAVVVVNPGQRSEHILGFLRVNGVSLPVARDVDRKVWRLYDIVALPTTVWIDRDGIVRAAEIGEVTQEAIDRHVRELVDGPTSHRGRHSVPGGATLRKAVESPRAGRGYRRPAPVGTMC